MPKPSKVSLQPVHVRTEDIALRLVNLRKKRGLTQLQLAESIGITRDALSNYEMGRAHLNDEVIIRLAVVLKTTTDEILGLTKDGSTDDSASSVRFVRRMQKIAELAERDQKVILRTIDAFLIGVETETQKKPEADE
jgi:transcriptional regulator with XRE-family HTH domain